MHNNKVLWSVRHRLASFLQPGCQLTVIHKTGAVKWTFHFWPNSIAYNS